MSYGLGGRVPNHQEEVLVANEARIRYCKCICIKDA